MSKLNLILLVLVGAVGTAAAGEVIIQAVPETGTTAALLGLGLSALVALRRAVSSKK